MRFVYLLAFAIVGIAGFLATIDTAEAATTSGWVCSSITTGVNPTGFRVIEIAQSGHVPGTGVLGCPGYATNSGIVNVNSGSSITLTCRERTSGTAPPTASTTREIIFRQDNDAFSSPATTGEIRRIINPSCSSAGDNFTFHCTSDGTATGSPRFGIVRIVVRFSNGLTYDSESDSADTGYIGILKCAPQVIAFTETLNPSVYLPGDVPSWSITVDSVSYNSGTHGNGKIVCGSGTTTTLAPAKTLGTTAATFGATLFGPLTTYPDDCALTGIFDAARASGIAGYTSETYVEFDQTSPPSGVTFTGDSTVTFTASKTVDRTLTPSGCATNPVRVMRAQPVSLSCTWTHARGGSPASGALATGFIRQNTAYDTTDFNSVDFTFGSAGSAAWTGTPKITAKDTNGTPVLDYSTDLKTYTGARSEANLIFIGTVSNRLDVASVYNGSVNASKTASPFVNASTGFIIGDDTQSAKVFNVRDASGNPVSGLSVTCQRTKPSAETETSVSMGTTNVNGETSVVSFQTLAPPGWWRYTCTGSMNGNSLNVVENYLHISPLTSNIDVVILQKVWTAPNGTVHLNITGQGIYWDSLTANITPAFPDDNNVTMRVQTQRLGQVNQDLIIWQYPMTYAGTPDFLFYANVTVPTQSTWEKGFVAVRMNISGKAFLEGEQITREVSSVGLQFGEQTAARLQSMADFFNMETTQIMPLLLILMGAMVTFSYTSNRLNSIILAIIHLLMAFAVAGSKASLDEMGPYYAPAAVIILLSFALMTLIKGWTVPPDKDGIKGYPR